MSKPSNGPMKTLVKQPPPHAAQAPIENALELTELGVIAPDLFTNTRELWLPPGARGIFGGAVIAQTLAAAQRTVPANFVVHSFHCFFVLAGDSSTPILYHVERVREGRSFCTRTVQARQRGKCIFTVTCSFVREGSGGEQTVEHQYSMPPDVSPPPEDYEQPTFLDSQRGGPGSAGEKSPFESYMMPMTGSGTDAKHTRKARHWVRARGKISEKGGHQAHLNALAYISDSYFIGTISRVHKLWRFPVKLDDLDKIPKEAENQIRRLNDWEGNGKLEEFRGQPQLGMMVSLDHTIYFHNPKKVRADDWMYVEMEAPWAGDGRGLVIQRVFHRDGTLLASCFQEGVVRLKTEKKDDAKAKL